MRIPVGLPNTPGAYIIFDDGKKTAYVGSTSNLYERLRKHKRWLADGVHFNPNLQALHNVRTVPLDVIIIAYATKDEALCHEQSLLDEMPKTWTLCNVATDARRSKLGLINSAETRQKLRLAGLGRKPSDVTRILMSQSKTGKNIPVNVRMKISQSRVGSIRTEESRQKQRLTNQQPIVIDQVVYDDLTQAAEKLGVSRATVHRRVHDTRFPTWKKATQP